jgi:hypothetical protein
LGDIGTFCNQAISGSVLVVSVNAQAPVEPNQRQKEAFSQSTGAPFNTAKYRLSMLEELIPERVPLGTDGMSLRKQGVADVFYEVIISEINTVLCRRNSVLPENEKLRWGQFAHFRYSDGALMLSIGIVIYAESEEDLFRSCLFDQLSFAKNTGQAYDIKVPCLTGREINHLNAQLPNLSAGKKLFCAGVTDGDIKIYSEIYRYFPNYSEVLWT